MLACHDCSLYWVYVCVQGMMYLVKGSTKSWSTLGIRRSVLTMCPISGIACMAWMLISSCLLWYMHCQHLCMEMQARQTWGFSCNLDVPQ